MDCAAGTAGYATDALWKLIPTLGAALTCPEQKHSLASSGILSAASSLDGLSGQEPGKERGQEREARPLPVALVIPVSWTPREQRHRF